MAELLKIERTTEQALIKERGELEGKAKFAAYTSARDCLMKNVLPEIKGVQWDLTDHGIVHIENVLDNIAQLLGSKVRRYSGTELYCLILSTLFHDVGNVFGRTDHQHNLTTVYNFVRPAPERNRQEQYIVEKVAAAHCGEAPDGSMDTLRFVDPSAQLDRKPVRLREVAAVLRLADELAEGRQRTSLFMQHLGGYPRDSAIYHDYARATEVCIDRGNERIALTYNFNVALSSPQQFTREKQEELTNLLELTHKRIIKLEQERRYARHYCDLLAPFKKTTVAFNFWIDGHHSDLDLQTASLTDLVVPGDPHKPFCDGDSPYTTENIISGIERWLQERPSL